MNDDLGRPVELGAPEKAMLIESKVTCPFLASAIAQNDLLVRNEASNPLASIDDIRELGNAGGGDLGDLLVLFASGNHAYMLGDSGKLDRHVPSGLFSLELPGSQGSHPGHSGILQGDSAMPGSGRLNVSALARLISRAQDGWIKRSAFGGFIAENLTNDTSSRVLGKKTIALFAGDLLELAETTDAVLKNKLLGYGEHRSTTHRDIEQKLTRLLGEDNLVGSCGEFGLLFAFLANKPGARKIAGEPALAVEDLHAMFVDKKLPQGWKIWPKSRHDWVVNTMGLVIAATREYRRLARAR